MLRLARCLFAVREARRQVVLHLSVRVHLRAHALSRPHVCILHGLAGVALSIAYTYRWLSS